jgi:3-phenylpropionate/cinnamic acid dioxygenase small subunit
MSDDVAFVRDRLEITNLIHSYGHYADDGKTDAFAALFADDARIDVGVPGVSDKASLTKMLKLRPPRAPGTQTRHVMTNLIVESQSERTANGAVYLVVMSTVANKLTPLSTGRYTFSVARADGGWRIRDWTVQLDSKLG